MDVPSKDILIKFKDIIHVVLDPHAEYKITKIKDEDIIVVVLPSHQS